ncbi:MAG: S8 family serine peptidase, partial [Actinobacteria bacterium]|nr:S8 family serine peptidase [Actinomycetota bacterium]
MTAVETATPDRGTGSAVVTYPLGLAGLPSLMALSGGRAGVMIGLVDGPVAVDHPALAKARIRAAPKCTNACVRAHPSCAHGTFVAGVLVARRGGPVPAICPGCTVLVRPIFHAGAPGSRAMPGATAHELAAAICECIDAGARLLNVSAALVYSTPEGEHELTDALDLARTRGVVVVVAAGNDGLVGGSVITRHPWVIPVVAYGRGGRLVSGSNLGRSIGRNGLGAPGEKVVSLSPDGGLVSLSGTSAAAPFVTGTAALLWSVFPSVPAARLHHALTGRTRRPLRQAMPPLLDAWLAYR